MSTTKPVITIIGFGWGSIGFLQDIDTDKYNIIVISDKDSFVYTPPFSTKCKTCTHFNYSNF